MQVASTGALTVGMTIGVWVLFCLARPVRYWKVVLILGLALVYLGLISLPFTRAFLNLTIYLPGLLIAFGYAIGGGVIVELLWRRDQRLRRA